MAKIEVGGYFAEWKRTVAETTVYAVYQRFVETGRFRALDFEKTDPPSHIFYDSDVAKWIEAAAYVIRDNGDTRLIALCDEMIAKIAAHQREDGYYNSYFQVYEPENIFKFRMQHELYCAGHLIEAAVAYARATGKTQLLDVMKRYADLIYRVFYVEKSAAFVTCGHPEIELALMRLYRYTREQKYLELARHFILTRGTVEEPSYSGTCSPYEQSHSPLIEQKEAVGHAVRALYLYAGAADVAYETSDGALKSALEALYDNIVERRMYVTGGVGSTADGEAFTYDFDLPNASAYAETCAGIALILFCRRMAAFGPDSRYADTIERALYNNVLGGISMDGKSFFYANPLEVDRSEYRHNGVKYFAVNRMPQRQQVFDCSCCPPNVARLIADINEFVFSEYPDGVYIDQLITAKYESGETTVEVESGLPYDGNVTVRVKGEKPVYMRLPSWAETFTVDGKIEEAPQPYYVRIEKAACFVFDLSPRAVYAPNVPADAGKKAVSFGPLILCAESVDNGAPLHTIGFQAKKLKDFSIERDGDLLFVDVPGYALEPSEDLYVYAKPKKRPITLRLVPYSQWGNRGAGDMRVWLL